MLQKVIQKIPKFCSTQQINNLQVGGKILFNQISAQQEKTKNKQKERTVTEEKLDKMAPFL